MKDKNAIGLGIDCCTPITASAATQIASEGYKFVGRYLVPPGYSKRLTKPEAQIITDAGLLILSVYETSANRAKGGASNGKVDGIKALAAAQETGMPTCGYIYFAVDYDTTDYDTIEAYLRAAKEQIGEYGIGVYGSFYVVEAMAKRGMCDGYWQCVAWSGCNVSDKANVYQYAWGKAVGSIGVDLNYMYDAKGLWNCKEDSDMVRYETLSDIPNDSGFQDVIRKLMDAQVINGDGSDATGNNDIIDLSHDQVRNLVFEYRGGAFDRKLITMGLAPAVET